MKCAMSATQGLILYVMWYLCFAFTHGTTSTHPNHNYQLHQHALC